MISIATLTLQYITHSWGARKGFKGFLGENEKCGGKKKKQFHILWGLVQNQSAGPPTALFLFFKTSKRVTAEH